MNYIKNKVLANLNVVEKRTFTRWSFLHIFLSMKNYDIRAALFCHINGKNIVLRILNTMKDISLKNLGSDKKNKDIRKLIRYKKWVINNIYNLLEVEKDYFISLKFMKILKEK